MAEPPYRTRWDAEEGRSYLSMPSEYARVLTEFVPPLAEDKQNEESPRALHFKFVRSLLSAPNPGLPQNAELEHAEILLSTLEQEGHSFETVDTDRIEVDELIGAAMVWAVFARTPIVPTFGSNKHKWTNFGADVPALFVYDSLDAERPSAVYPHKLGDGYATIVSFLRTVSPPPGARAS
jgi:hypothetical protein